MYIDLLTKIKNAERVGKKIIKTRFSKQDKVIADILSRHGFVGAVEIKGRPLKRFLFIHLQSRRPVEGCKFLSKPSVKQYAGYKDIYPVKGGHGLLVVSTSKGIMGGREARKEKTGGELLFEIW